MGRVSEETEERHVLCFSCLLLMAALCGLLVQPTQAEPVDSVSVEDEHQAAMQTKTEAKEITIYIRGGYKAVTTALLDAVDEGTPIIGIADFDSLSAFYGLMGIYRKGRISSGFYGHRFRLTFPPITDVVVIAGAYWTLPYIDSVEPEPVVTPILKEAKKKREKEADTRIGKKLAAGAGGGLVGALTGGIIAVSSLGAPPEAEPSTDPSLSNSLRVLNTFIHGMWGGNIVGTAVGVSRVDPQDNFLITLAGSALLGAGVPYAVAFMFADVNNEAASGIFGAIFGLSVLLGPIIGATIASERWRKPLSSKPHLKPAARHVSVGLVPNLKGGLSAVATLRF